MPYTWEQALDAYRYPVNLDEYVSAQDHQGWFNHNLLLGDRAETIGLENRFQAYAADHIEAWLEVVFWKLYSQANRRNKITQAVQERLNHFPVNALWQTLNCYVQNPSMVNFSLFQERLFRSPVIAVAATFPAFLRPDLHPMVDTRIAKWVGACMAIHNAADPEGPHLIRPRYLNAASAVLTMTDFDFMQRWREWCVHNANKLSQLTLMEWRARDVEMAVFYAWGGRTRQHPGFTLNPLPAP